VDVGVGGEHAEAAAEAGGADDVEGEVLDFFGEVDGADEGVRGEVAAEEGEELEDARVDGGFEGGVFAAGVLRGGGLVLGPGGGRGEGACSDGDGFAPGVVELVVGLGKDVVGLVLHARGLVVPVGALPAGLGEDVRPDVHVGCDEEVGADAGDGTWVC
jgi:hypothetical protein